MTTPLRTPASWAELFRRSAAPRLPRELSTLRRAIEREARGTPSSGANTPAVQAAVDWAGAFADDHGRRLPSDGPMLAWMLATSAGEPPASPDDAARAWWSIHHSSAYDALGVDWAADGPLFAAARDRGSEAWAERERSALHALSWRGLTARSAPTLARAWRAASWMLEGAGPEQSVGHPWACHVFAAMALDANSPDEFRARAEQHARALVGGVPGSGVTPDRRSACILFDAASWLDAATSVRWQRTPPCLASLAPAKG